jgi:DNA-binding transcriptional MerR regulator
MATFPPESKASARRLKNAETLKQVIDLRMAGLTCEEIGHQLGVTKQSVQKRLTKWIAQANAMNANSMLELQEMQLRRLERLRAKLWPLAFGPAPDMKAIDRILNIEERIARLKGLDAPARKDITSEGKTIMISKPQTPEEAAAAIEAAYAREKAEREAAAAARAAAGKTPAS